MGGPLGGMEGGRGGGNGKGAPTTSDRASCITQTRHRTSRVQHPPAGSRSVTRAVPCGDTVPLNSDMSRSAKVMTELTTLWVGAGVGEAVGEVVAFVPARVVRGSTIHKGPVSTYDKA
eukprot:535446-Prorocentrum_minimum.AAC.1